MSQPPLPPFSPGAVHVTPAENDTGDTEFENGPDADLAQPQGPDPDWTVSPDANYAPFASAAQPAQTQPFDPNNQPLQRAEELEKVAGSALRICQENSYQRDGKNYLKVEAWNGIAWLCGMIIGTEPTVDKMIAGIAGIAARSTLKTAAGKLLSHAEGFVGQDEQWWSQPVSDRINMAQTRAVGRICRHILSIVVTTMNHRYGTTFEVTPYEELQRAPQPAAPPYQQPQPGVRHPMPTQPYVPPPAPQWPQPVPSNLVPLPQPYAPPNQAPSVGQQGETWQGMLVEVREKRARNNPSQIFHILFLADGRNASTYNKSLSASAQQFVNRNVEMLVIPRGQGMYNVGQLRPL